MKQNLEDLIEKHLKLIKKKLSSGITQTKDIVKVISSLENRTMLLLQGITGKVISQEGG